MMASAAACASCQVANAGTKTLLSTAITDGRARAWRARSPARGALDARQLA
jgi:hypothetical protein